MYFLFFSYKTRKIRKSVSTNKYVTLKKIDMNYYNACICNTATSVILTDTYLLFLMPINVRQKNYFSRIANYKASCHPVTCTALNKVSFSFCSNICLLNIGIDSTCGHYQGAHTHTIIIFLTWSARTAIN